MDSNLTRAEHNEFAKRMEDEHSRQNKRIAELETKAEENNKLLASIEKIATNVENIQKQLSVQGGKIEKLESRDGENWRKFVGYIVCAVVGIVVGFVFRQIGM